MLLRATSDLHLTQRTAPWVFAALREMRRDAEENGGITLILGDVLEQPHTVHMRSYIELRQILAMWPGKVYVFPGNHDQYGDRWENALVPLSSDNCRVVSEPVWGPFGRILPYVKPERFKAELDRIPRWKMKGTAPAPLPIVWCHAGFRGAYRNAMNTDRDGVSCRDIPPNHVVVSGHYHMPQNLGRIIYTGSPYETSFAEEGQAKGWLRWEDAAADPFPVRIPFSDLGAPRHFTIQWDPSEGPPQVPEGMLPTDRPRIVTQVTRKEALAHHGQLQKAGLEGVPILAAPSEGSPRQLVDPTLGPRDAVGRYVASVFGTDDSKPDPDEMDAFAEEVNLWAV